MPYSVEVEVKTPFDYYRIMVANYQKIVKNTSVLWVLRIYIIYDIKNEFANIILCLHQSIEVFGSEKRKATGEILRKGVSGRAWIYQK